MFEACLYFETQDRREPSLPILQSQRDTKTMPAARARYHKAQTLQAQPQSPNLAPAATALQNAKRAEFQVIENISRMKEISGITSVMQLASCRESLHSVGLLVFHWVGAGSNTRSLVVGVELAVAGRR